MNTLAILLLSQLPNAPVPYLKKHKVTPEPTSIIGKWNMVYGGDMKGYLRFYPTGVYVEAILAKDEDNEDDDVSCYCYYLGFWQHDKRKKTLYLYNERLVDKPTSYIPYDPSSSHCNFIFKLRWKNNKYIGKDMDDDDKLIMSKNK
jgi:hypothetical protein